jgi:hypothetical protein
MVQPGLALGMLPVVLQPCDDNLVIEAGGPRGEDRQLQRENELPRKERDIRDLFFGEILLPVTRRMSRTSRSDGAAANGNFQFLETDLKKLRAVGYA